MTTPTGRPRESFDSSASSNLLRGVPAATAFGYAFAHPFQAFRYLTLNTRVCRALGVSKSNLESWRNDLFQKDGLPVILKERYERVTREAVDSYSGGANIGPTNEVLYYFVRAIRPTTIVETGVAAGFSSAYLLQGLRDNGTGHLFSIDLPNTDPHGYVNESGRLDSVHVSSAKETGCVIPEHLRDRWTLTLGRSADVLPEICNPARVIEIFFHDSDHAYANMMREFSLAWPCLRPGGWLLSDDISWNTAFVDFAKSQNSKPFYWGRGRGALQRVVR